MKFKRIIIAFLFMCLLVDSILNKSTFKHKISSENNIKKMNSRLFSRSLASKVYKKIKNHSKIKFFKPNEKFEFEEENIIDPILKTRVIVEIRAQSFSFKLPNDGLKKEKYLLPEYTYVSEKGEEEPKDLNEGSGGKYIYLSTKTLPIHSLNSTRKPVNFITILVNSKDCGENLKLIDVNLNKGTGGEKLYLCYGHLEHLDQTTPPIQEIYIKQTKHKLATSRDSYKGFKSTCLLTNLNLNVKLSKNLYLCYRSNSNAPKKLVINDLFIDYKNKQKIDGSATLYEMNSFTINNGSANDKMAAKITKSESLAEKNQKTISKTMGAVMNYNINAKAEDPIFHSVKIAQNNKFSFNVSVNYTSSKTNTKTLATSLATTCEATKRKYFKCGSMVKSGKYSVNYSLTKVYTNYHNENNVFKQNGVIKSLIIDENFTSKCCYKFCEAADKLCDGAIVGDTDPCPFSSPPTSNNSLPVTTVQKLPKDMDGMVVVDIKFVSGENEIISCPAEFSLVRCEEKSCDLRKGNRGGYIFLCQKRKKLSQLNKDESVVNFVRIVYGQDDCGDFKKVTNEDEDDDITLGQATILESGKKTKRIICFGYDKDLKLSPISNLEVNMNLTKDRILELVNDGYEKQETGSLYSKKRFLWYKRNNMLPAIIEISDIDYSNQQVLNLDFPKNVDIIEVEDTTVTKKITYTDAKEITNTVTGNFGAAFTHGVIVDSPAGGTSFDFTFSTQVSTSDTTTKTKTFIKELEVTCTAPKGKKYRCTFSQQKATLVSDYKAKQVFKDHQGNIIKTHELRGKIISTKSGEVAVSTCCLSGCDPLEDVPCDLVDKCVDDLLLKKKIPNSI